MATAKKKTTEKAIQYKDTDIVTVIGKKSKAGKAQHLTIGKSYDMPYSKAKLLIKNGSCDLSKK